MADLQKIADDLSNLTVLEAAELAKLLEEKWGVSAAAAVAVAGPAEPDLLGEGRTLVGALRRDGRVHCATAARRAATRRHSRRHRQV